MFARVVLLSFALSACGDDGEAGADAGARDAAGVDGGSRDGGPDAAVIDAAAIDGEVATPDGAVGNPDGIPSATTIIYANDYEAMVGADVVSTPGIAVGTWSDSSGYGPSGGWQMQPDPIDGTGENEDSAGWSMAGATFPVDAYDLVTVSFMLRISGALLDEIARGGPFWAHVNKTFDFKYWNAAGDGEGGRNGIHFGRNPPQFWFSEGGGGQFRAIGPDWRTLADRWVWVCFVVDMRGSTPDTRYLAAYYRPEGSADVVLMDRVSEQEGMLQAYEGRGFLFFFSPLFGYWDDMLGRDTLVGALDEMSVSIDRVRVADGWPTGLDGPP